MKIRILSALLFIGTLATAQGIEFEHKPWKEVMQKAKEEGKAMFVDSYATWCGPCKRMAKNVFTKATVGDFFNENFINLKLDMEKEDGVTFGHKYPVSAYPTLYFLSGDGAVIHKVKGGKDEKSLLELGQLVVRKYDTSGEYEEEYEKGNRDYDLVYKYVKALNKSGKPSLKISNDYLRSNPDISEEQRLVFLLEAAVESDSKLFEEVIANKKKIQKLVTPKEYKSKVTSAANVTVSKAIEYEVESLLDDAIESYKKALGKNEIQFLRMTSKYYKETGDKDEYYKTIKKLYKEVKKDEKELQKLYVEIVDRLEEDRYEEIIEDAAKQLYDMDDSEDNVMRYVKLLINQKNLEKAEEIVDKKMQDMEKNGEPKSKSLTRFKTYIERARA